MMEILQTIGSVLNLRLLGSALLLVALVLLVGARIMVDHAAYSALNQGILDFLVSTAVLSIGLGLFNLVPIPPLDGAQIAACAGALWQQKHGKYAQTAGNDCKTGTFGVK